MKNFRIFIFLIFIIGLSACKGVETAPPPELEETEAALETPVFSPVKQTDEPATGLVTLNLWLGKDLIDGYEDPAYLILKDRIEEFNSLNPGINVNIRIKEINGSGGILSSLNTANSAAPLASPDLIAVDLHTFEAIRGAGLINPAFDSTEEFISVEDYYPSSLSAITIEDAYYGLPIGGDLLVLFYDSEFIEEPPKSWSEVYQTPGTFAFAAANTDAYYQICLYQSISGELVSEDGDWALNENALLSIFDFFSQTRARGLMTYQISILDTYDSVWEDFSSGTYPAVINWTSNYTAGVADNILISQIPTLSGETTIIGNFWYWTVTSLDETKADAAKSLAEFLTDPEFINLFTQQAGLVPVQKSAFDLWEDSGLASQFKSFLINSIPFPAKGIVNTIGPKLTEYTIKVLKNEVTNDQAAQAILDWVNK